MKLFQKGFIFLACVFTVILMCGAPETLIHYLDTTLEWERTDGIRETGPVGALPFFIILVVALVPFVFFVGVSLFYVFRFALRSFKHSVSVYKEK